MLWLLTSLLFAQEPDMTMIVEASKDIEFFVAPIKVHDYTSENIIIETVVDKDSAFTYMGSYIRNIKISTGRGGHAPASITGHDVKVYNERTIKYAWENCNYKRDPLECSVKNSHYYLETIVTVDDNQLVVKATLYDPHAQVVLSSSRTDDKIIRWIKQQEITTRQEQQQGGLLGGSGQATTVHKPKEELPLKWEIPHTLTDRMVQQLILGTSASIKIELD
ncbi:MAG: hypothetical protein H8E97_06700 [Bacteroidetes bacterium]|nr:hypothetical protein [Bacteroidota bacterium]